MKLEKNLLTIKEASRWASAYLKKDVSESNISYLMQYGKVKKHNGGHTVYVDMTDLKQYYAAHRQERVAHWKTQLGDDLNWALSFDHLREKDTTKHVHRLHPYKGKFIPQLVEYFIEAYFKKNDILLDPFCGSGTSLVQAHEMGIHIIGIDVSHFNAMISEAKLLNYDFSLLEHEIKKIKQMLMSEKKNDRLAAFEQDLSMSITNFNNRYFPSPEFKFELQTGNVDENNYAKIKEAEFMEKYQDITQKHAIKIDCFPGEKFLDKWYMTPVREEIDFIFKTIKSIKEVNTKKILAIILSRTIRSCRATTHSDLATLKQPQITPYYCWKHKKICKPLLSTKAWFYRYAADTVKRLKEFAKLKTDSHHAILTADSREVDIFKEIEKKNNQFYQLLKNQKIKGIFTSPPYVGQINYHQQHAYAYDLFGFKRCDNLEIGPLYKGQGLEARTSYVDGITKVLQNSKKYLTEDFDVFLVANDKYNLYPSIAEQAGMAIVNQFKRPVLNRTERDKSPYSEIIFHLKK